MKIVIIFCTVALIEAIAPDVASEILDSKMFGVLCIFVMAIDTVGWLNKLARTK